jgi:hypothetical protein
MYFYIIVIVHVNPADLDVTSSVLPYASSGFIYYVSSIDVHRRESNYWICVHLSSVM